MKIEMFGPLCGHFGYAVHCREMALALERIGQEVWAIPSSAMDGCPCRSCKEARVLVAKGREFDKSDVRLAIIPPMPYHYATGPSVLFTTIESLVAHPNAVARTVCWDRVIVPSRYSARSYVAGGLPRKKVSVVPEGVRPEDFADVLKPDRREELISRFFPGTENGTCVRYLYVGDWSTRKCVQEMAFGMGALRAKGADVYLSCLVNAGGGRGGHIYARVKGEADYFARKGGAKETEWIHIDTTEVKAWELPEVYQAADVYVHLGRGEAWNLTVCEAYAAGCLIVAPEVGGHTDFLLGYDWIPVPCRGWSGFAKLDRRHVAHHRDVPFATIDPAGVVESLETAYDWSVEDGNLGRRPRKEFAEFFSWDRAAGELVKVLEDVRRREKIGWKNWPYGSYAPRLRRWWYLSFR